MPITQRPSEEGSVLYRGGGKPCHWEGQLLTCESIPSPLTGETPSSLWLLLIPRFMLCGVIGLGLLCLYAVFVSLSNNLASSQVSERNPHRGRGSRPWSPQSYIYLSLIFSVPTPNPSTPSPSCHCCWGFKSLLHCAEHFSSSKFLIPKLHSKPFRTSWRVSLRPTVFLEGSSVTRFYYCFSYSMSGANIQLKGLKIIIYILWWNVTQLLG